MEVKLIRGPPRKDGADLVISDRRGAVFEQGQEVQMLGHLRRDPLPTPCDEPSTISFFADLMEALVLVISRVDAMPAERRRVIGNAVL